MGWSSRPRGREVGSILWGWSLICRSVCPHPPLAAAFLPRSGHKQLCLHLRSMVTRAEVGAEMLLLEAWQVRVAPRSSLVTWGTDRVFWTVLLNVLSKLESIRWLSLHHVTCGIGFPGKNGSTKINNLGSAQSINPFPFFFAASKGNFSFVRALAKVGGWFPSFSHFIKLRSLVRSCFDRDV